MIKSQKHENSNNIFLKVLHTPVCDLLGIEFPVFQAGMGYVAFGTLAGEVSKAGGLGVIGAAYMSSETLCSEINKARSITDKPFAVDILFGLPKSDGSETQTYTREVEDHIRVVLEEKVPIVVSGLGNPSGFIKKAHDQGIIVMSVVGNTKQAVRLEAEGVDVIIASGHEGGGHTGRVGTSVIVPSIVDKVKLPVIAAGGLVDGRGLVAALSFGAQGIWMGTRFVATQEASVHFNYKEKITQINDEGTVVTRAHSGKPCRLIKNNFTQLWETKPDKILPFPTQLLQIGKPASDKGRMEGDVENGSCPAGQGAANIDEIKKAGQVVRDTIDEACHVLKRLLISA